ncbi:hypothetical protein KHA80_07785 [Anaerobacillus sp. HL2]|nr:hypothetical protein KHA80_07785 [Anaerobacillus sp. HL2]
MRTTSRTVTKNYTTIEIQEITALCWTSTMINVLRRPEPEKKDEVKRCQTVQEMFDLLNSKNITVGG